MTERDDDGADAPSPENVERMQRLNQHLQALTILVEAHAAPLIRAFVTKELEGVRLATDEIDEYAAKVRTELENAGASAEDAAQAEAEVREKLSHVAADSPEDLDRVIGMAMTEGVATVVLAWTNALGEASSRQNGVTWLRLSLLGDDMLPKDDPEVAASFNAHFESDGVLDPVIGREVLRAVRRSLPAGKVLPPEMTAALDVAWDIVIVP